MSSTIKKTLFTFVLFFGFSIGIQAKEPLKGTDENLLVNENCNIHAMNAATEASILCGGGGGGGTSTRYTNQITVVCESYSYRVEDCEVPGTIHSFELIQSYSGAFCTEFTGSNHDNYGYKKQSANTIRVNRGCRAKFRVVLLSAVKIYDFQCNSLSYGYQECNHTNFTQRSPIWMSTKASDRTCSQNITWGQYWSGFSNPLRAWVNDGCRATFSAVVN